VRFITGTDKRKHVGVSFVLVWISWLWSLATRPRRDASSTIPWRSMGISLLIGVGKEVADAIPTKIVVWPWCQPTCTADGYDMIANGVGIISAGVTIWFIQVTVHCLIIILAKWISSRSHTSESSSPGERDAGSAPSPSNGLLCPPIPDEGMTQRQPSTGCETV